MRSLTFCFSVVAGVYAVAALLFLVWLHHTKSKSREEQDDLFERDADGNEKED